MNQLISKIESLLFIAIKPLTIKFISEKVGVSKEEVVNALEVIMQRFNIDDSGIHIQKIEDKFQMVTAPFNAEFIGEYLKDETTGELTTASLETLTVIAYRGPITKSELELIRGVNCGMIIRNLLMRGLIEEKKDKDELLNTYTVTFDFLKYLGIHSVSELPDFLNLNNHENIQQLLNPVAIQDANAQIVEDTSVIQEEKSN